MSSSTEAKREPTTGFPPESEYTDPAKGTDALVADAIAAAKARTGPVPVKAPLHPTYLASLKAKEQSVSQVVRLPGDMSAPPPIPLFNVDVWKEILSFLCVERDIADRTDMDAVCSDRKAFCALARTCRGIRWIFDGESTWLSAFLARARSTSEKDPRIAEIADKFNAALCVADLRAIRSMVPQLPHKVLRAYNGQFLDFAGQVVHFGQPKRIMQNRHQWMIIHVFRAEVYAKHIASKPGQMTFGELGHQILRVEKKEPRNPTPEEIQASYKQDPENPWQMIACLDLLVELGMCDPSFDCIVLRACERTDPTWPQSLREVYLKALIDVRGYNVNKATPASGWTPLHEAVQLVDPWLANFLLERGADPHKPLIRKFDDVFGLNTTPREAAQTIHHQQASEQSAAVLAVFRRHGIDVD